MTFRALVSSVQLWDFGASGLRVGCNAKIPPQHKPTRTTGVSFFLVGGGVHDNSALVCWSVLALPSDPLF